MTASYLKAGAASADVTPVGSTFLYGYPHTPRLSTGVHDRLLASALYIENETERALFIQADVIWLSKAIVAEVRRRIAVRTGLAPHQIMVTASHTHSGPVVVAMLSNADDHVVPPPDEEYVNRLVDGICHAAESAVEAAEPAVLAMPVAECGEIGGNRLDPSGARITQLPLLAAMSLAHPKRWIGVMLVNPVHPTVLHDDSTLVSGDFPSLCREFLQKRILGGDCPVLCHLGAAGNQSPRHVLRAHTFDEARRLGEMLGAEIERALLSATFVSQISLICQSSEIELPPRDLPNVEGALNDLCLKRADLAVLAASQAPRALVRTAECAIFGAEETVALARAEAEGTGAAARHACLPAEIQAISIGSCQFVGWPGEVFVEFALELRERFPHAAVITLANGELQGYLVTAEAVQHRCYEAGNAIFASPASGNRLVTTTCALLENILPARAIASATK